MQNKQLKRPYFPPEITAVEFRVERGLQTSDVQVDPATLGVMEMGVIEGMNMRMGDAMQEGNGYFGTGGSSYGNSGSGYFGYSNGTYF